LRLLLHTSKLGDESMAEPLPCLQS
jgi:hypothetical protein